MEQMIALSTQNPLTLLVKFGIMAWNDTCGNENCSGHGECHNGTCVCEVMFKRKKTIQYNLFHFVCTIKYNFYVFFVDSVRWIRMSCSQFKLLHCVCNNILYAGICVPDTTYYVHRRGMAENEGAVFS